MPVQEKQIRQNQDLRKWVLADSGRDNAWVEDFWTKYKNAGQKCRQLGAFAFVRKKDPAVTGKLIFGV